MKFFPLFLIIPMLGISTLTGCRKGDYRSTDGVVWNTTYHIVYEGPAQLSDSILTVLDSVGKSLNFFSDSSSLSRINSSGAPVETDIHFRNVYNMSRRINHESGGMFDPTLSPLITAWGFGKGHAPTSDTLRIDSLLKLTGILRTHLKNGMIYKDNPGITFNFSAIAKGYGCDCVAAMLRRNGVANYMVEIGGEINASGCNPNGKKWNISIDAPVNDSVNSNHESQAVVSISGKGMATSGNYRNFHATDKGAFFGHTISPLSGRPIKTDILSATVIADNTMEADALATACMALGSRKALALCRRLNAEAFLILEDTVVMTPGFRKALL